MPAPSPEHALTPVAAPLQVDTELRPDAVIGGIAQPGSPAPVLQQGPPAVSPAAPPLAQLAAQIVHTLTEPAGAITEIALSPEDLGHVRLSIHAHEADPTRVVVTMTFERPEVMDLFRRHADQLIADMRAAGFSGADLGFAQSDRGDRQDRAPPSAPPPGEPLAAAPATVAGTVRNGTTTSLDLRL
jgi:Flagellar hook-length control protein FliK